MTDIASLVFEIDSTQAVAAEKNLDKLAKTSERVETSARKVRTATEQAGIGVSSASTASERATRTATQHAMAMTQAEKVMRGSLITQAEATSLLLRNAQAQASLAKEQERAAKTADTYAAKVDRLRASLDPFAAIQTTLAQRTKLLDDAMRAGAITADQHAVMLSKVTKAATNGVLGLEKYSGGLKNGGQYATQFSYQLNDVVTSLMSGQKPMQVLAQQGGQIFQIFQMAAMEAGGFKAAIRALYLEMAPLLATFGLWIAGLAAAGAAVAYLVNQHSKQSKAIKDLNKELKEQNTELAQISPYLSQAGIGADMAADGLRNFDTWLRTSNISLEQQNKLLRENALRKLNDKAMEAAEKYSAAQKAFDRVNKPGPTMMSSGAPGGFGVVAPVKATDPKNNPFYKEAKENLDIAKASYEAINDYRNKAYLAPEAAFGSQAKSATKAAKAVVEHTKAIELNTETVAASTVVWPEATAAAAAYEAQQKALKEAANDNIKTMHEQAGETVRFSSTLERMATELEDAASMSRNLGYDIDDIARAINSNDWISAFAGLVRVLSQVEAAFKSAATAKEKYNAAASVASAVGGAIGGTAGSTISGAAAGAQLGTMIAPGIGTAIGAVLGGIGGFLGGSSAKKKAKAQAAAQKAAEEAQRQSQIADTQFSLDVALLRAQGEELKATNLERDRELARLAALSPALAETQKQLYALDDAATAAAAAAEKAAQVEAKRLSIQDQIDKLTMSDADLLAKARASERAEAVALDPALGALIDKLYGLQDAASEAAKAKEAADKAYEETAQRASAYWQAVDAAAQDAAQRQAAAASIVGGAIDRVIGKFQDLSRSLNDYAASLSGSGLGGAESQAYTKSAIQNALNKRDYTNVEEMLKAYVSGAKDQSSTAAEYQAAIAWARSVALQASAGASGKADKLAASWTASLPKYANGGSMVIGGNSGIDQNLISVNDQPVAWANQGEVMSFTPAGRAVNDNGNADVAAILARIEKRMEKLEGTSARTAVASEKAESILRNVSDNGDAVKTVAG